MTPMLQRSMVGRDGLQVILPHGVDATDVDSVRSDRSGFIRQLRAVQQDDAGFYTCLPAVLLQEIAAAPTITLDLRATAVTRFASATRLGKTSRVGGVPWLDYRAQHPDARLQTRPRARVLTLYTDELGTRAFDLDTLGGDERRQLYTACMENKVVAGHKLGEVLHWLFTETGARPSYCVDTALLMSQLRSGHLLSPYRWAAMDNAQGAAAIDLLHRHRGQSRSIAYVAECARAKPLDHAFDSAATWSVSALSDEHMQFASNVVRVVSDIMRLVGLELPVESVPKQLAKNAPFYDAYQKSLIRLAEAHVRGVPFDSTQAKAMEAELVSDGSRMTTVVALDSPPDSRAAENLKEDFKDQQHVTAYRTAVALTPAQVASRAAMLKSLTDAAEQDGYLHSLITFSTATGRTSSYQPAIQNLPRGEEYRSLIRARAGQSILSVDYSSMELYIAVALVERALDDVRQRLREADDENWFIRVIRAGLRSNGVRMRPLRTPESDPAQHATDEVAWLARTVLRRRNQCMATVLSKGLDPHLVTGVDLARRACRLPFSGHPLAYISGMSQDEQQHVKEQLDRERQMGKATNFGLLYGQQATGLHTQGIEKHGIDWSLTEASEASDNWFNLYPEFRFWQLWTKYCQSTKRPADQWRVWRKAASGAALEMPAFDVRLYKTSTLSGRPVVVLDSVTAALSHQAQGTGADILAQAIADLPAEIAGMLLFPVHDELVFEVPTTASQVIASKVQRVMVAAANGVLRIGSSAKVESHIGRAWC